MHHSVEVRNFVPIFSYHMSIGDGAQILWLGSRHLHLDKLSP